MKKNILAILFLIVCSLSTKQAFCAIDSQSFISKFANCSQYIDNDERRISIILGWATRRCYYEEITHNSTVNCSFKELELQDVVKIMKNERYDYTKGFSSLKGAQKYFHPSYGNCKSEIKYNNLQL